MDRPNLLQCIGIFCLFIILFSACKSKKQHFSGSDFFLQVEDTSIGILDDSAFTYHEDEEYEEMEEEVVVIDDFGFPEEEIYLPAPSSKTTYSRPQVRQPLLTRSVEIPQLQVDAANVFKNMISYVPYEESSSSVYENDKITAYIDFPARSTSIQPNYGRNNPELANLKSRMNFLINSGFSKVRSIDLTGYASPDGNTRENEQLAGNRAIQFKNYLLREFNIRDNGLINITWVGEDWDGLRKILAESRKDYANQVIAILDRTNDPDTRRKQIKALRNGAVFKDIETNYFKKLRRMELNVQYESRKAPNNEVRVDWLYTQPEKLTLADLTQLSTLYRPGTEQYRDVYELMAYRYPESQVAQLNAAAASLSQGDHESAHYFLEQVKNDPRALNNLGVLALMEGYLDEARSYFRKTLPQNPRLARENMKVVDAMYNTNRD